MNTTETEVPGSRMVELDVGPGQRLQSAREAISLSIEEVSARLHLDTRTLGNLEADNYDKLPAPTFVRGYLRSYARLLNISADPIIDGFDRRGLEPPPLVADISTSDEVRATDPTMRLASTVVGVVLIGGVAIWWQTQFGPPLWDDPIPENPPVVEGPIIRPPGNSFGSNTTQTNPLAADPIPPIETVQSDAQKVEPDIAADVVPLPPASAPPGVGRVVLRVRSSSWIEVYDGAGERLYYSTGQAGDTIDVQGSEPIKVLLGFADGVQVEYNGQAFDSERYTTRGLARFQLGEG
ncbi:MAG: helix-turn-helix domain-containing protein [Chromatiales bacterium]|jgi:cytoskeleton protein RodZ|nr:helix-turn-helix domain-containing protein [Chromatiales bacterium]